MAEVLSHSRSLQETDEWYQSYEYLTRYHGWVLATAFGLLMPLAIVISRCFKERRGIWFHLHWVLQIISFVFIISGVVLGHYLYVNDTLLVNHRRIGIAAAVLAGVQIVAAVALRPKPFHYLRRVWAVFHWNIGRVVLVLGIINLYIGMSEAHVTAGYYIALSVVLAFFLVVAVIKDAIDILCMPPVAMVTEGDRERAIYSNQPLMTRGDRYAVASSKEAGADGHALGKKGPATDVTGVAPTGTVTSV